MAITISNPMDYKVALYVRLSKEDGDKQESESVSNQRAILEQFAENNKLNVFAVYVDDGFSGANFDRPDFKRMTDDIENGKINMIVVKDLSRFGRNRVEQEFFVYKYSEDYDVRFIAINDDFDTDKDDNELLIMMKNWSNEQFLRDTSKKIKTTKRFKQQKGLFIGGKAPYGYKKSPTEKNVIVIDEDTAPIVRDIFHLALDGKSCRQIAMILNERQIPTPAVHAKINLTRKGPYSGKWSSERISFMLQNEVYIGNMVQGRSQKISYKSEKCRKIPREDWIVVENTHEPIIDRGTFEKVAMLIASRNLTRSRTYEYLLKGLIFCHECGYPLGVINRRLAGNREMLYFICRTYQRFTKYETCTCHCVRVDDVTNAVLEQIHRVCRQYSEQLNLEQITDKAQKMLREEKRRQGKDIAGAKARLAEIQSKIDKSYEDRLSGIVDEDVFQRVYQKLKDEQTTLRKKLQKLERSDHEIELDKAKVKALVERFLNAEEYSRELLVSLIERIELTKEKEILIYFKFKELDVASRL
ncbi:MAG TPA: recombinase family protein [Candidatus Gallacutalibacter stercoravium]|nr:recombinase family protein [Candidatus Gallacutalibacter stercoravium]